MLQNTPQDVANGHNQFAFEIYSQLIKLKTGNVIISPFSIYIAMAIAYEGTLGQTRTEMQNTLHFPEDDALHEIFASVNNNIPQVSENFEFKIANALWCQNKIPFLKDYVQRIKIFYKGKVANLDFYKKSEKSRQIINKYIEEQTNKQILDLIPPRMINHQTMLVITNAIYFNGFWKTPFNKSLTKSRDFFITQDKVVKSLMMHSNSKSKSRSRAKVPNFNYAKIDNVEILELPYKGKKYSMFVFLPTNDISLLESSITADKFCKWKKNMKETNVAQIFLPKFNFDTKSNLVKIFQSLGIKDAFSESNANFKGMLNISDNNDLVISNIIHQAFIKVDELGTEAGAATAIVFSKSGGSRDLVFNANHPFLFIIQENTTGIILFIGKVMDPSQNLEKLEISEKNQDE